MDVRDHLNLSVYLDKVSIFFRQGKTHTSNNPCTHRRGQGQIKSRQHGLGQMCILRWATLVFRYIIEDQVAPLIQAGTITIYVKCKTSCNPLNTSYEIAAPTNGGVLITLLLYSTVCVYK